MAIASASVPGRTGRGIPSNKPVLQYCVLALIAATAALYQVRISKDVIDDAIRHPIAGRQPFALSGYPLRVKSLKPEATGSGLRMGDTVMGMNGHPITGAMMIARAMNEVQPGGMMKVEVMRGGKPAVVAIPVMESPTHFSYFTNLSMDLILGLFAPVFSILLGFYVAAVRPRDPLAWIVMGVLLTFSQVFGGDLSMWGDWIRLPAEIYHTTLNVCWPLFMFLFGLYFPSAPPFDKRWPWAKWLLLGPYIALSFLLVPGIVGLNEDIAHFGPFARLLELGRTFIFIFTLSMVSLGILLLGFKSGRATRSDARRRLRLLLWGVALSLTPILICTLYTVGFNRPFDSIPLYVFAIALLALLLFPLTLAYVIVVNRALDVRVVVRQGLQYAFARSGLAVLRIVVLGLFAFAGYMVGQKLLGNTLGIVLLALLILGCVFLVNASMKRLAGWVDRRFFRNAYDAELVLTELSDRVRSIREAQPLVETVCKQIAETLHVSKIAVLLERKGEYATCHAFGFPFPPDVVFGKQSAVASYLQASKVPLHVYFEDEGSWLYRTPGLDDGQRSKLAYLGAELLLPLSTRDQLLGFIASGQKMSEEPYSKSDVRILATVAAQTGLALENAQLTTAIASEMAQRERLAREVEIAREVQERLFPQSLPPIENLDYAGMCRTALGVGGDYYDFLALSKGGLGFAVADVAGKGISAALLMASLQASLRGDSLHEQNDLAGMMSVLNRRVFEASATNRYATFFYAQYNAETRRLDFVNAGHNPPILLRRCGGDWQATLLEASGTVVGLLPMSIYGQTELQLAPGDYLVAFTDGVSEAMNGADEEWGEERLTETIRACAESALPAAETMKRILSAADVFVAGAPQHDDMTLVVLRVLG